MILYSVTVSIDNDVADEWLQWMREKHVPDVLETGCFVEAKICRLLDAEESGGLTYSFQYLAETEADYERYKIKHAQALQADVHRLYAGKFAAFRTLLQVVKRFA